MRNKLPGKNYGPVGNAIQLVAYASAIYGLSRVVLWSFFQTYDFAELLFIDDSGVAVAFSLIVQFAPNLILLLAALTTGRMSVGFKVLWGILTALDAGSNIGARMEDINTLILPPLALWIGYTLDVVVVLFEELIVYFVSAFFVAIGQFLESIEVEVPAAIYDTAEGLGDVSGANLFRRTTNTGTPARNSVGRGSSSRRAAARGATTINSESDNILEQLRNR